MDPFIGQIMQVGFRYAPVNWLVCNGTKILINQNNALYALLGTTFGGDGTTNFALPDARGRTFVGAGAGTSPPLTSRTAGDKGGFESVSLNVAQLPTHSHTATFTTTGNPVLHGTLTALKGAVTSKEDAAPETGSYLGTVQETDTVPVLYVPAANISAPGIVPVALAGVGGTVSGIGGVVTVAANGTSAPVALMPPFLVVTTIIATNGIWPERPD